VANTLFDLAQKYLNQGLPDIGGIFPPPPATIQPVPTDPIVTKPLVPGGITNLERGDGRLDISPFRQDPRVAAAYEAFQRNKQLESMDINDPFKDEISLEGAYYGDMPEFDDSIGQQTFGGKFKEDIRKLYNNPLVQAFSPSTYIKMGLEGLRNFLPVNRRAIAENIGANLGIRTDSIGRIVNTGDYNDPSNVMAGYGLNNLKQETIDKRIDTVSNTLKRQGLSQAQINDILSGQLSSEDFSVEDYPELRLPTGQISNNIDKLRAIKLFSDQNKFIQKSADVSAMRQKLDREKDTGPIGARITPPGPNTDEERGRPDRSMGMRDTSAATSARDRAMGSAGKLSGPPRSARFR
tara:strand:+ start:266 stop:1321 length:1056 start_codon:yes stop_codon:yes gene_type:complete